MIENPENSLPNVIGTASATSVFVYDGDGNRVKSTINSTIPVTTAFVGNHTEWDVASSSLTRYYYAGSTRVAMRKNNIVNYLLSDHLGSTSVTTDENGQNPVNQLYLPWGEVRYSSGSLQTKYTYTGQYSNVTDFGLMYYNARWYDSALGRFISADTIVPQPGNPQAWDRFSYVQNNPLRFVDPTGHKACDGENLSTFECDQISKNDLAQLLRSSFRWSIIGVNNWAIHSIEKLIEVGQDLSNSLGGDSKVIDMFGKVEFSTANMKYAGLASAHKVILNSSGFSKWTAVHELGHSIDIASGGLFSDALEIFTGGHTSWVSGLIEKSTGQCPNSTLPGCNSAGYFYGGIPPKGADGNFNKDEDFAESFAGYFYPDTAVDYINNYFSEESYPHLNYPFPYEQSPRFIWIGAMVDVLTR